MFIIGQIYAVYERIFNEDCRSVNQFKSTMERPRLLVPKLECLARDCKSYKKYEDVLSNLYSKLEDIPMQPKSETKSDFVLGYAKQKNTLKKGD